MADNIYNARNPKGLPTDSDNYHPHKWVGIHDSRWIIEVVKFEMNPPAETPGYPRWYLELLTDQNPSGHAISFHLPTRVWWLRRPNHVDQVIEDGETYITRNQHGDMSAMNEHELLRGYRRFIEGTDQ